tara:strand:+ start:564 stop:2369 length:1806 start_codon:yes stop_codon:yes gene_type:complete
MSLKEDYKNKEIGKDWYEGEVEKLDSIWGLIPEGAQENIKSGAKATLNTAGEVWSGAREFKPWYQPGENLGALGIRGIEGVGWLGDKLIAQPISSVAHNQLGIHKPVATGVGIGAEMLIGGKGLNKLSKFKLKPKHLGITSKIEKITPLDDALGSSKRIINITNDIEEITSAPSSYLRKVSAIYKNHEGGISWKQAMAMAKLPKKSSSIHLYKDSEVSIKKGGLLDPDRQEPTEMYSTGVDPVEPEIQLRDFDTVPSEVRRTMAWESGLKDGIFDYDVWKSKVLRGNTYRSRLTAAAIETAHQQGVSFEKYRDTVVMPQFKKEWQPILKELGINPKNLELHHIGAIKASVGLYDGLQYGSKEWNSVTKALLDRYVKLGDVPENLMPVVGSRTDPGTPHYIAHKYLDDMVGPIGEKFFTPEIRRQMKSNPAERIRIANEYADIVKKSEQIVVQAQEIWDLSYKGDIPESLVEKLLDNPAIFDEAYQPPQLRNMVQTAIDDLDINPLKRDIPNALIDVLERIDAGQNMILDLINNPKLTPRKAIQRHNIKDPRNKQLVLKLVKSVKTLTPQQVQRIMQEYGLGGKGGTPISYNIDDILPDRNV